MTSDNRIARVAGITGRDGSCPAELPLYNTGVQSHVQVLFKVTEGIA